MSATYTIKAVGDPREWSSQQHGGRFLAYPCDLEDAEGHLHMAVEWSRKTESKAPAVGDRIAGDIQAGQYGDKFKMDYDATKELGGGGGTRSAGGSNFKGGGKSPDQQASIERQVALKVLAPRICKEGLTDEVRSLVKELERFIGEAASGGGGPVHAAAAPPQASDTQGVHERIQTLLEAAGVNWAIAQLLKDFALTDLQPEKQDEIIAALQDPERKDKCAKWLEGEYTTLKGALPAPKDDGGDLPF